MDHVIYGVNRFYDGYKKIISYTDWFSKYEDAKFATMQSHSSKQIIKGIYHDNEETREPWIEITENIDRT